MRTADGAGTRGAAAGKRAGRMHFGADTNNGKITIKGKRARGGGEGGGGTAGDGIGRGSEARGRAPLLVAEQMFRSLP